MAQSRLRLTCVAATTAAAALAATPALATEPGGAAGAAAGPPPPAALLLPNIVPLPSARRHTARPSLHRVRVVPRRMRRGRRARVRLTLSTPARLRIVLQRRAGRRLVRVRTITAAASAGRVSIRLPRRVHGHALVAGRYRVSVVAIDATGTRSATVRRTLRIRKRAR
jgi:hypothetical protein